MTYEEIAKELGVSRQTVSLIEKKALEKLRPKLKGWYSDEPTTKNIELLEFWQNFDADK